MKLRTLYTTIVLITSLQIAKAQKIVLHMHGNQKTEYSLTQIDSITFVNTENSGGDNNGSTSEMGEGNNIKYFPWSEINVAQGRTIKVKFYMTNSPTEVSEVFFAKEIGRHIVTLTYDEFSQDFVINVCPPAGTYRRSSTGNAMVNHIYEYMPAPGNQVNGYIVTGEAFPANCTHEQACDSVLAHISRKWPISLGGQGGYLIAGFDHSVPCGGTSYDLCIKGNPFSYQSEPGIIWVSQDDNGDGLPNDQWFELAGSEFGTENHATEYAITYFKPEKPKSAVYWRDSNNDSDSIPYMSYWKPRHTIGSHG